MDTRILDLDGSVTAQEGLLRQSRAQVFPLRDRAPRVRLGCRMRSFHRFERELAGRLGSAEDAEPAVTFYGSGDFHHVSLALLRRRKAPFNLLVLDKHPDWMRGIPFLHCGTWLYHAAALPQVGRIFHVGGELDFDNAYRWLAPWPLLASGKIVVLPAVRTFRGGGWDHLPHEPLRPSPGEPAGRRRVEDWLGPYRAELAARPLYVSLDKDVLLSAESVVNWDSGHLVTSEVLDVLEAFLEAAEGDLAGMDVVGDWSPVRLDGLARRLLHWTEHPSLDVDPREATGRNEALNLAVLGSVTRLCDPYVPTILPFPAARPESVPPAEVRRSA